MKKLKEWFDGLTKIQQIIAAIVVPIILFLIAYTIAYEASAYNVRFYYTDLFDRFEREVDERHYAGAFEWVKTWYIWLTYVVIVGILEFIIWKKKKR